jgi:hypothetical protein
MEPFLHVMECAMYPRPCNAPWKKKGSALVGFALRAAGFHFDLKDPA